MASVSKEKLFRIYNIFKRSKNKVFVMKDFNLQKSNGRSYFDILKKFNIIEVVPVVYKCGVRYTAHREIVGYKYLNNLNNLNSPSMKTSEKK